MDNISVADSNISPEPSPNAPSLTTARKRFVMNVLSNAGYIGAQTILTFWMTPYLIGFLGIAAYGMIPLTQNIISYTAILTTALNTAVSRYLTIELDQRRIEDANKTFNTSLFSILGLFLILTPAILSIALIFPNIFDIPSGWETDTRWLFILMAVAFFLTVATGVFSVSAFIHSEFTKYNLVNFTGLLFRVACLVFCFSLFSPRLWYAGAGFLSTSIVVLIGCIWLWHKLTPELKVMRSAFDRGRLKEQLAMGGWMIVNMAGVQLMSRVDLIIVNAFYGAVTSGGYATLVQFTALMEYLVSAAGGVIRPIILILYSRQDIPGLQKLCVQTVKMFGYALALPVGLLCGLASPFLALWLGPDFQNLSILLIAILVHQAINFSVRPMLFIHTAYNKVRWPGITTLICGIGSVFLGLLFARLNLWGAIGVALAVGLTWTIKNAIYMPLYTAHIMDLKWWVFFPSLMPSVIGTLLVGGLSYASTRITMPGTWLALGGYGVLVSILYAAFVWWIGFNRGDRQLVISLVPFLNEKKNAL